MKALVYHRLAIVELFASSAYYGEEFPENGERFIGAVEQTIEDARKQPLFGRPEDKGCRSWRVKKYPYRVMYRLESERFRVMAVADLRRMPGYWLGRVD
ncbi:MAG: type II toxin-antitoxin system RelE/ParE family toxin [Limisphaerales bacterium]